MLIGGVALSLIFHLIGSWKLIRYEGDWDSIRSESLGYDIPFYDTHPEEEAIGRVVIYPGFSASAQVYFPLALSLLRSGYAVRIAPHSGSPNSKAVMSYKNHVNEATEAARHFLSDKPDLPLFLIGHSEGTRYAMLTAREMPSVDGVIVFATVSASLDGKNPANVLALVAENDFENIKRQTTVLLSNGTGLKHPDYDKLYGSMEDGTARMAASIEGTNHASIIFNDEAQRRTLNWLNQKSGIADAPISTTGALKAIIFAVCALISVAIAVVGLGLMFSSKQGESEAKSIPAWAFLILIVVAWGCSGLLGNSIMLAREIPLLVYGRVLAFLVIASIPLALVSLVKPRLGAGIPRGSWKVRAVLLGLTATLLIFDRWLICVAPGGDRLMWFAFAALISGIYFALDEFLRRGIQRATDWQTGFALGLAGAFVAALAVAGAAFFVGPAVGQFLVVGASTLFILMALGEIPATYLYATTRDWLMSWWVRIIVVNGFLSSVVPLVTETEFRKMIP